MAAPEFTETFIIDGNWQRYSDFIHRLRGLVADPAHRCRGLLQLPPENPDQAQSRLRWFAVVLHAYNLGSGKEYDKLIQDEFPGYQGHSATVQYVVFSDAVSANIEVILIKGDKEDPANVYGDISAVNTKVIEGQSVLLCEGQYSAIAVRPGEAIPLSRSIVAVPINGNLHVRADLWDYHHGSSVNDQIAKGTAIFKPKRYGTDTQKIPGERVVVKVTWRI